MTLLNPLDREVVVLLRNSTTNLTEIAAIMGTATTVRSPNGSSASATWRPASSKTTSLWIPGGGRVVPITNRGAEEKGGRRP